jgi:nitrogen-specific signal transduction histidine kinase
VKLEGVRLGIGSAASGVARHELSSSFDGLGLVQLRPLLEASGHAVLVLDEDDVVAFASSAAAELLCAASSGLERRPLREHAALSTPGLPLLVQACDGLRRVALEASDGRRFVAALRVLHDRRNTPTHVALTLEAARIKRSPENAFEALGRLAAELGHEINNQLAAALNYGSIVQRRIGATTTEGEHLGELQQALWRASAWASSLRVVGRQRSATAERLQLDQVLLELEPLLRHIAGDVALHFDLDAARSAVHVPRAHLEQLIVGMTVHALGRAGAPVSLTVRTRVESAGPGRPVFVRLTCALHDGQEIAAAPAQRAGARARGILHRAVKRCGGRLHHDPRSIWVDFAIA